MALGKQHPNNTYGRNTGDTGSKRPFISPRKTNHSMLKNTFFILFSCFLFSCSVTKTVRPKQAPVESKAVEKTPVGKKKEVLTNKKVAIIGYASRVISEHLTPKLTTIDQHGKKVGSTSARLLLKRLDEFDGEPESIVINSTVQKRFTS